MNKIDRSQTIWMVASLIAIAAVVICSVALVRQNVRISELTTSQQILAEHIATESDLVRGQLATQAESIERLVDQAADFDSQIASLSRYASQLAAATTTEEGLASFTAKLDPATLAPGIYVLASEDEAHADEASAYTIYHATTTVRVGNFEQNFQFGIARSGLVSWQVYFDYDNDGMIDTGMLDEFVDSIPFASYVSSSLDSARSQPIYERFLVFSGRAEYLSPDQIEGQSNEISRQTWLFVTSTSERLGSWIWSNEAADAPAPVGDPSPQ